jgi:phosphotransferase system  glucose/maltose/N-acetylglucosamine-specific IIC component
MDIRIKILIFWLVLTCALWVIMKVSFLVGDTSYNWKFYKSETWIGCAYYVVLYAGLIVFGVYGFVLASMWWFN